jgi:type II secretory pathway predicted ATPase ExeA
MYEHYYGMKQRPFSIQPQADFLYLSQQHRMALSMLQYSIVNRAMFTVVTGDIGTGKTTLIRYLLRGIGPDITVGVISNTHRTLGDLLEWLLLAFRVEGRNRSKPERYEAFVEFLENQALQGRRALLIVDEAQNLTADMMEELRMLSNVNADDYEVLQTMLVGQLQLRGLLRDPLLRQFAQRVGVNFHLRPLGLVETVRYITHRLRVAGRQTFLFDRSACEAIFAFSQGVPRIINIICDLALVYGYAAQRPRIDGKVIAEIMKDKREHGGWLFENEAPPPPTTKVRSIRP